MQPLLIFLLALIVAEPSKEFSLFKSTRLPTIIIRIGQRQEHILANLNRPIASLHCLCTETKRSIKSLVYTNKDCQIFYRPSASLGAAAHAIICTITPKKLAYL